MIVLNKKIYERFLRRSASGNATNRADMQRTSQDKAEGWQGLAKASVSHRLVDVSGQASAVR